MFSFNRNDNFHFPFLVNIYELFFFMKDYRKLSFISIVIPL